MDRRQDDTGEGLNVGASRIEDYALLSSTRSAALVGRDGSIDWLCAPRFDSGAMFASLLGDEENGRWRIAPAASPSRIRRQYRGETMVLETEFDVGSGRVRLVDLMPLGDDGVHVVRIVEGVRGEVEMEMDLAIRFDDGDRVPWVTKVDGGLMAVAGDDAVVVRSPLQMHGKDRRTQATFTVAAGERIPFTLSWFSSFREPPVIDAMASLASTEERWREWSGRCTYEGPWREAVVRSLITLKSLTFEPSGAIVAAPTTSLPEEIGGARNWDYRYCWLRDATFTLYALIHGGYTKEARDWRDWLLRAVAGQADQIQILYGIGGERRVSEIEADWLTGFEGSRPVRLGNAAVGQLQLDVFGEIFDVFHVARRSGLAPSPAAWRLQRHLLRFVADHWHEPDSGIWEIRADPQRFSHSRVMAWVAVDRAIRSSERFGLEGSVREWKRLRQEIHDDVCEHGYDPDRGTFRRAYGSDSLDASLLLIPLVGFLPPTDARVTGTVRAIESELMHHGFLRRYDTDADDADGLAGSEGVFLAASLWLADVREQCGRHDEACQIFERVLGIRNDVGLLSEEYDPVEQRMLGNFPQAFSHIALVNTATNLAATGGGTTGHRTEDEAADP